FAWTQALVFHGVFRRQAHEVLAKDVSTVVEHPRFHGHSHLETVRKSLCQTRLTVAHSAHDSFSQAFESTNAPNSLRTGRHREGPYDARQTAPIPRAAKQTRTTP